MMTPAQIKRVIALGRKIHSDQSYCEYVITANCSSLRQYVFYGSGIVDIDYENNLFIICPKYPVDTENDFVCIPFDNICAMSIIDAYRYYHK